MLLFTKEGLYEADKKEKRTFFYNNYWILCHNNHPNDFPRCAFICNVRQLSFSVIFAQFKEQQSLFIIVRTIKNYSVLLIITAQDAGCKTSRETIKRNIVIQLLADLR